jgi:hypothetical protein
MHVELGAPISKAGTFIPRKRLHGIAVIDHNSM